MKNDLLYLSNITECIVAINTYTRDGKDSFMQNKMIQDAVIRNFEIIGEATKRLSLSTREKYSEIPWRRIAGFRDVLIHDYLRVDLEEVWGVIKDYLPDLEMKIKSIIDEMRD